VSHVPQLGRCGLCGRVDSPPQGEPIRARVTVGGFRAQLEARFLSHLPTISRVDGVLIDEMSFRERHYLNYGLQGVCVEPPRQRNVSWHTGGTHVLRGCRRWNARQNQNDAVTDRTSRFVLASRLGRMAQSKSASQRESVTNHIHLVGGGCQTTCLPYCCGLRRSTAT
jgi:hypothetical protein